MIPDANSYAVGFFKNLYILIIFEDTQSQRYRHRR